MSQETERLISELFAGQVCRKCGQQACRIGNGRFYCDPCFTLTAEDNYRQPRTYKVSTRFRKELLQ